MGLRFLSTARVAPAMVSSIATGVMGQVILVASGVIVARALGPENRGVLALVFVLTAVAAQVGSLGVPVSVTYWIAARKVNPALLLKELRRFRNFQHGAILVAQAGLIFVVLEPRSPAGFVWVGLLSLTATAARVSQMYGLAVLQGLRRFNAFNALRLLDVTLYMLGVVGLWFANLATLTSITIAVISASVASAGVIWLVVLRVLPSAAAHERVATDGIVSFGVRSLVGSTPPIETFRLDQLLVGLVLSPVALGYFIVAQAFTNLTRFIGQSIGMVTYPRIAAADQASQLRMLRRDFALGVVVAGAVTAVLIAAAPELVPFFFGSDFAPAVLTAQILLVATFLASVRRILVEGTRGSGRPTWGACAELLTLAAVPAVLVVSGYTDALAAVALVLAVANLLGFLVVVPALLGISRGKPTLVPQVRAAPRILQPAPDKAR
jgi:O-antigen/teichoic acid export membrane protein